MKLNKVITSIKSSHEMKGNRNDKSETSMPSAAVGNDHNYVPIPTCTYNNDFKNVSMTLLGQKRHRDRDTYDDSSLNQHLVYITLRACHNSFGQERTCEVLLSRPVSDFHVHAFVL